jgi:Raf kinase inhibitor-like YbhB/YbcL family protein
LKVKRHFAAFVFLTAFVFAGCQNTQNGGTNSKKMNNVDKIVFNSPVAATTEAIINVRSTAFENGSRIPDHFSAYYDNISPALVWSNVPQAAKSIVLIAEDPDAPREKPFLHWIIVNLPPSIAKLPENLPKMPALNAEFGAARQSKNGFGDFGYLGPKPPPGHGVHHYHFQVFALNIEKIDLAENFTLEDLTNAMQNRVIAKGELVGTYERSPEQK